MFRFNFSINIELGNRTISQTTTTSWNRLKGIIKRHHGDICHYCGNYAPNGQVDHILPLTKGGTDAVDNLVWSCEQCNQAKGDKTVEEWMQTRESEVMSEIDINDTEIAVLVLNAEGHSYREISSRVWGDGKFGSHYNDKINSILNKWSDRLPQQVMDE